jgi:hypothetical protein
MPTRRPLSSKQPDRGEDAEAPEATTSSRFRDLAKGLIKVPLPEVKVEEERLKKARKTARKQRKAKE